MYFSSCDFLKPKPVKKKPHYIMCTFLCLHIFQLITKTLLEGKQMQVQSPPEHPDSHQDYPQLWASGSCQSPSFISLSALCAIPCSRIHLLTCSVKQAHRLVQSNRELWEIRVWIRTLREKCSAEGPPFLFSLITWTLCKRLASSFLLRLWVRWPDQSSWIFKCC